MGSGSWLRGIGVTDFFHSLLQIESPFKMVVLVVLVGGALGVTSTLVVQLRMYASHRADVLLKRELVERGLSVEEIERVISAGPPRET